MDFDYLTLQRHVKMMVLKGNYFQMAELQAPAVLRTWGAAREGKIEGLSFRAGDLLEFIYIFNWKSLSFPVVFYLQKEVFLYYASQIRDVIRGLSKRTPTANHALFLLAMGWKMILSI